MITCPNCGQLLSDSALHCTNCGAKVVTNPEYHATYSAVPTAPKIPVSAKVKGFIGMGLGIEAFCILFLPILFSGASLFAASEDVYFGGIMFFYTIIYAVIELVFSIAGVILCASSRNSGFKNAVTIIGMIASIITIALSVISVFISMISMCIYA